jgi:hypothetical protein
MMTVLVGESREFYLVGPKEDTVASGPPLLLSGSGIHQPPRCSIGSKSQARQVISVPRLYMAKLNRLPLQKSIPVSEGIQTHPRIQVATLRGTEQCLGIRGGETVTFSH